MSRNNNPFACLAGNSNETDPEHLAKQQRKPNRPRCLSDSLRRGASSGAPSASIPGLHVTTQHQASLQRVQQDGPDSPMDPELLAALQESLLTAPEGAIDPDMLAAAIDNRTTLCQSELDTSVHQAALTPDRQHSSSRAADNYNELSAQFPPLPGSSSQPLSPQAQRSLSSSSSMWESFNAVFDACTYEPAGSSVAAAQAPEKDLSWALVGSPSTVSQLAAATGLSEQELLLAQQTALLEEASKQRAGHNSNSSYKTAARSNNRGGPQTPAATAGCQESFPALVSSASSSGGPGSPLQVGRSPLSLPPGWKGGRLKPRGQAVKVLNRGEDSSSGQQATALKPGRLDLHWDLQLDGLRLKEDDADWELAQFDGMGGLYILEDEVAGAATRKLVEQQSAEAEAEGTSARGSGNDRYSKQAVRMQLSRAEKQSGAAGGSSEADAAAAHALVDLDGDGDEHNKRCGARSFVGSYDWRALWTAVKENGWEPVDKRDGGGGSHLKFRRVLLLPSGRTYMQTNILPSTPSDNIRAIKHAASSFIKKEQEKEQLLAGRSGVG